MRIGIAGGGIMGRLLCHALIDKKHELTLLDQDNPDHQNCSMVAAGMLAPVAELEKCETSIYEMGMQALTIHWPRIINDLDADIYYQQSGSLVVAHPNDQAELLNFISMIESKLRHCEGVERRFVVARPRSVWPKQSIGITKLHHKIFRWIASAKRYAASQRRTSALRPRNDGILYQKLNAEEIIQLEPALSKFQEAYYLPAEGQVDNQALMHALHKDLLAKKLKWLANTRVSSIRSHQIITENETLEFDMVFDCRGLGANTFDNLQAVRGELIWLHAPDVNLNRPVRLMHPRYHLYVAPRPDNIFIVGASEIYADDYSEISVKTTLELLTALYYLHPSFAEARILKTATHCRPALADHLPKIKCTQDCIAINGLYRHGYLIAPTIVDEIVQWMESGRRNFPELWCFSRRVLC